MFRRTVVLGVAAATVVLGGAGAGSASIGQHRGERGSAAAPAVDLHIVANSETAAPGSEATVTFRIGNKGTAPTKQEAVLQVVTPFYTSLGKKPPKGCKATPATATPPLPQTVKCTVPAGIKPQGSEKVAVPLLVAKNAPRGTLAGAALVAPAPKEPDAFPGDNLAAFTVLVLGG
ncbi:hypothetical protein ACQEU3_43905 [Spirillospora sp. CA-253888]